MIDPRPTLLAAVAALAIAAPALAISKKDMAVVDQYRDKIAAARAEPGVAAVGTDELDAASAELPALADYLERHRSRDVARTTAEIDTKIQTARTRAAAVSKQRDADTIARARDNAADARDAADAASADAAAQAARADNAQAAAASARDENARLRQAMADYQMKQTQLGATLVLQDVVFQTAKADLKPGAADRLRPLAQYLQANPKVQVRIDGHTDAQGGDAYNQRLSEDRAGAVRAALVGMGVDAGRIQAVGHGKADPVADNNTEAGRQQNRRVEVTLVGQQSSQFSAM